MDVVILVFVILCTILCTLNVIFLLFIGSFLAKMMDTIKEIEK